jgi:DNA end-binding protein Ku
MLRVVEDAIALHGLLWPDEVRAPEGVAPDTQVTVSAKELDLADALMDTLGEIDLEELHDEYREALEEVVAAKAAGEAPPQAPEQAPSGKVLDLMAALEKSVREAKESRGEEPAQVRTLPQRKSARAAPKQTGGKKSTAKSTTAKKTAASKKTTAKSSQGAKKTASASAKKATTAKKTPAKKTTARKRSA